MPTSEDEVHGFAILMVAQLLALWMEQKILSLKMSVSLMRLLVMKIHCLPVEVMHLYKNTFSDMAAWENQSLIEQEKSDRWGKFN